MGWAIFQVVLNLEKVDVVDAMLNEYIILFMWILIPF